MKRFSENFNNIGNESKNVQTKNDIAQETSILDYLTATDKTILHMDTNKSRFYVTTISTSLNTNRESENSPKFTTIFRRYERPSSMFFSHFSSENSFWNDYAVQKKVRGD